MKNISLILCASLLGLVCACSSTQESTTTGATPTPTVTVPSTPTAEASAKPPEDKPADPPAASATAEQPSPARLALQTCSDESRNAKGCTKEMKPVCAEVDTGIRCIKAPCPSTAQQTFNNSCLACMEKKVRGYWAMSCEEMNKPTAP